MDVYLIFALVAGGISMGLLIRQHERAHAGVGNGSNHVLSPTQLLEAFLTGASAAAGARVCRLALDPTIVQFTSDDRLYVFVGGLAIILLAVYGIRRLAGSCD